MPSESIRPVKLNIAEKLKNPARRRRLFLRMAQDEIAMQLRELRELRGFDSQSAFAKYARMQQSAVSRIENANYQGWTFKTLFNIAAKLDARLRITFETTEDVLKRFEGVEQGETIKIPENWRELAQGSGPGAVTVTQILEQVGADGSTGQFGPDWILGEAANTGWSIGAYGRRDTASQTSSDRGLSGAIREQRSYGSDRLGLASGIRDVQAEHRA